MRFKYTCNAAPTIAVKAPVSVVVVCVDFLEKRTKHSHDCTFHTHSHTKSMYMHVCTSLVRYATAYTDAYLYETHILCERRIHLCPHKHTQHMHNTVHVHQTWQHCGVDIALLPRDCNLPENVSFLFISLCSVSRRNPRVSENKCAKSKWMSNFGIVSKMNRHEYNRYLFFFTNKHNFKYPFQITNRYTEIQLFCQSCATSQCVYRKIGTERTPFT